MLRVTIELVPHGDESQKKVVAVGEIANVASLPEKKAAYVALFREQPFNGVTFGPYVSELNNWPRGDKGAWDIVHATLQKALKGNSRLSRDSVPLTLREAIGRWGAARARPNARGNAD